MRAREELRLLVDSLPDAAVEELAAIGRLLDRQARYSAVEEVTTPEEFAIVREALLDDGTEADYTLEEAKEELAARRRTRGL
jgi:hypothetical protein